MLKWWLDRAALLLAICVLAALVAGWYLPGTYQVVVSLAYIQIVLAIIVAVREAWKLFGRG